MFCFATCSRHSWTCLDYMYKAGDKKFSRAMLTHLFTPPCTPDKVDIRKGPIRGTLDPPAMPSLLASQILRETTYALLTVFNSYACILLKYYLFYVFKHYMCQLIKKISDVYQLKSLSTCSARDWE